MKKKRLGMFFFFSSRRRHTRSDRDWSSDVCSSDLRPSRSANRRSARCMRRRPQVSGAESPMDPKIACPAGGAKPPRVNARAGSIEKRSGSASHSGAYSKTTVSPPRPLLLRARPTGRARPWRSIWTSTSAMTGRRQCALETNAFWQFRAGQPLADAVAGDVGDLAQAIEKTKRLQDGSVDADADVGVAGFDLLQGRAGRECALRHDRHGQPPATASVVDIRPQLAQDAPHSGRGVMWCRHLRSSRHQDQLYVARRLQIANRRRETFIRGSEWNGGHQTLLLGK